MNVKLLSEVWKYWCVSPLRTQDGSEVPGSSMGWPTCHSAVGAQIWPSYSSPAILRKSVLGRGTSQIDKMTCQMASGEAAPTPHGQLSSILEPQVGTCFCDQWFVLVCLDLRGFLGCGMCSTKTRKVSGKRGRSVTLGNVYILPLIRYE